MRANLAGQISDAQGILASQMAALQSARSDGGTALDLANQLASLKVLSQTIELASPVELQQLRAEVMASVAASSFAAQQAQANLASSANSPLTPAEYAKATADLDRLVAATVADDERHEREARDLARQRGIDLSEYEKQREELEKARLAAIAKGDKVAERQAEAAIAVNTKETMIAAGASAADIDDQQRIVNVRTAALSSQQDLEARRPTTLEAEAPKAAAHVGSETTTQSGVHEALSPEGRAATQKAAATLNTSFDSFASSISLDTTQIALSTAPDAHTKVEVPKVAASRTSPGGQSLA